MKKQFKTPRFVRPLMIAPLYLVDVSINGKETKRLEVIASDSNEAKRRAAAQITMTYPGSLFTCHVAGWRSR